MSRLVKHFVKQPKIYLEIDKLTLGVAERNKLTELVTLLYHQKLLNKFLEYLEEEDKKIFLELLVVGSDANYLEFLHQRIVNLEQVVEGAIIEIEQQIMEDLTDIVEKN